MDPDSRALLRLSSRSPSGTVRHPQRPLLSWPSPPPRSTSSTVGLAPSPLALLARAASRSRRNRHISRPHASGSQSSRTWGRLRRALPTSLRSPTSSDCLPHRVVRVPVSVPTRTRWILPPKRKSPSDQPSLAVRPRAAETAHAPTSPATTTAFGSQHVRSFAAILLSKCDRTVLRQFALDHT
jgi:hypothetical protein